jgi:hypothetical protein
LYNLLNIYFHPVRPAKPVQSSRKRYACAQTFTETVIKPGKKHDGVILHDIDFHLGNPKKDQKALQTPVQSKMAA